MAAPALRERQTTTQQLSCFVLALAFLPGTTFPLALRSIPYRPSAQPVESMEMTLVARSRWPFRTVRMCRAISGDTRHQYEPLGWADDETLVYRVWERGHYGRDAWATEPGSPGQPWPTA